MSSKKIWQYPEATSITNDDYILMDSNTETGSQCLKANKIGAVHITKTVTERKVYKASDDNANGFSEVTVAVPYTDVHYDKDDIVSFIGENLPLKSVTAYIEPQQDLHGYDAPWVGGAGKNKFDIEGWLNRSGATYTKSGNTYTISAASALFGTPFTFSDTDVAISASASSYVAGTATFIRMQLLDRNNNVVDELTANQSYQKREGVVASKVRFNWSVNGTFTITEPQIELGSQATSYAPYSNICPIEGWTEANVTVCGKNRITSITDGIELNSADGTTKSNGSWYVTNYSRVEYGKTYYVSGTSSSTVCYYDRYKNFTRNTLSQRTITPQEGECYVRCNSLISGYSEPQIEEGTEATSFSPIGQTYTIDLDGTRYGGTLDVVSGVLTVDRAYVDLGSLSYTYEDTETPKRFRAGLNPPPKLSSELVCSCFKGVVKSVAALNDGECCISGTAAYPWLRLRDDAITDATAFKTAVNGQQLVYELATPLTFYLDEVSISNLVGDNNFWADTGEIAVEWQTLYVTPTT